MSYPAFLWLLMKRFGWLVIAIAVWVAILLLTPDTTWGDTVFFTDLVGGCVLAVTYVYWYEEYRIRSKEES